MKKILLLSLIGLCFILVGCSKKECIKSHTEIQYEAPPSVVVGGTQYGGGTAIPVGNIKPVEVTVCDEYKIIK